MNRIIIQGAMSHASGAEITKLLRRPPVPNFLRRERYQTLSNRREATGSVVTEPVCASGSERRGQFCSQRSQNCRSCDRNLSGSGERAIDFEFHLEGVGGALSPLRPRGIVTSCRNYKIHYLGNVATKKDAREQAAHRTIGIALRLIVQLACVCIRDFQAP
jgi:hypothetical protein